MDLLSQTGYRDLSKWVLMFILLINLNTTIVVGELTAVVKTNLGPVQGEILTTVLNSIKYAAFKGIRYGKPPVGYLRFKPPVSADPWTETLNATTEAEHCARVEFGIFKGSEDCLFLNVFTPVIDLEETTKKLRSIIIYMYGGAWMAGSSSINIYGPDFLLERDVLVVTFNYRGGAFGFLSLNHPNATGNAGLKDQNLVLKWVQANIRNFGGNPKNVTIMGASSGGMSVGYHIISDASTGLFHGGISMSGAPLMPWAFQTPAKALKIAQTIGMMIGSTNTDKESLLKAFYDAPVSLIASTTYSLGQIITFAPTIENSNIANDVFLTKCSVGKYFSGNFSKVPQILGYMPHETLLYATCKNNDMNDFYALVNDAIDVVNYIGMGIPKLLSSFLLTAPSVDFENLTNAETSCLGATVTGSTEILFITAIDLTQRILEAYNDGKPLFYYRITFILENAVHTVNSKCPINGAAHADDIAYLFYSTMNVNRYRPEDPMTRTLYWVTTMWTNFAKYGNPTPEWVEEYPVNFVWPSSGPEGFSLNIGDELVVEQRPISNFVKEMELYYSVYLSKMNACY